MVKAASTKTAIAHGLSSASANTATRTATIAAAASGSAVTFQRDLAEIFRLRGKLEGHGARRACSRISAADLARLEAIEQEMETVFSGLGWHGHLSRFDELNNEFHGIIARAADSPRLETILASSLELPASIFNHYAEPHEERTRRTHRQHREIIAALKARNGDWAEAAMCAHLFSISSDPAQGTD